MKRHTFAVVIMLFVVIVIAILLPASKSHAIGSTSSTSFRGSTRLPIKHGTILNRPFSGIVEGTVFAISTTSITLEEKTYRSKNTTSTEMTFLIVPDIRISADQEEYATSSMSDVSIGSSVSLVIERVGKDAGKVREIRLQPNL